MAAFRAQAAGKQCHLCSSRAQRPLLQLHTENAISASIRLRDPSQQTTGTCIIFYLTYAPHTYANAIPFLLPRLAKHAGVLQTKRIPSFTATVLGTHAGLFARPPDIYHTRTSI